MRRVEISCRQLKVVDRRGKWGREDKLKYNHEIKRRFILGKQITRISNDIRRSQPLKLFLSHIICEWVIILILHFKLLTQTSG